jgi:hypothetical protein
MRYLFVIVLLLCLSLTGNAQVSNERESLRGLDGLGVFYKVEPDKLKEFGLQASLIATEVTLRLRKGGIRVLESEGEKKQAHLVTGVSLWRIDQDRIGFVVTISVLQWVYLARAKGDALYLTTYNRPMLYGDAAALEIREAVRFALADVLDKFINDYLAANTKR